MSGETHVSFDSDVQEAIIASNCQQICADAEARSLDLIFADEIIFCNPIELIPYISMIMPGMLSLRISTTRLEGTDSSKPGLDKWDLVPLHFVNHTMGVFTDPHPVVGCSSQDPTLTSTPAPTQV